MLSILRVSDQEWLPFPAPIGDSYMKYEMIEREHLLRFKFGYGGLQKSDFLVIMW